MGFVPFTRYFVVENQIKNLWLSNSAVLNYAFSANNLASNGYSITNVYEWKTRPIIGSEANIYSYEPRSDRSAT